MQYWSLPTSNKEGGGGNILHHEKTGAVDVEVVFKKILLPPSPESWLDVVLHHMSPVALREQEREGKNAGTLLINKAALLSGEVECVYFYPQGHSGDFRCSWVLNLETFCVGSQAALKKNKTKQELVLFETPPSKVSLVATKELYTLLLWNLCSLWT